jgi:hypothetical protein
MDHYLSEPWPGHRKNEVIVTTGLGVVFWGLKRLGLKHIARDE